MAFPLIAGASGFKPFQGYMVGGALEEDESKIIQGHILGGVTAEDGAAKPEALPDAPPFAFTVFFDPGDGATVSPKSKTVTNGRAYGELPAPVRDGYAFDGWRDADGVKISANTVVSLSANQTLCAQWNPMSCEVRFDANGGSVKMVSIDIPVGGDYGELPRPVRTGYSFDGWYFGVTPISDYAPLILDGDHTLCAHWTPDGSGFADVPAASSYYEAVRWAVERGITSGTSPETFSPNSPCKLRHVLMFLWRANGSSDTKRALDSVSPGTLWAYENGLIPFDILYNDEAACTRSDAVTYLWKLAGSPVGMASLQSTVNRFADVSPESDYAAAIAWALDNGITNGTTDATFSPDRVCTRGQIVTFLYRCYA